MDLNKKINTKIFIALILVLLSGYISAFVLTNRYASLDSFDNIMSEDTAQIARNTISGDFFATKYITPASYAYFPHIINHPDYIRYPFIILIDSVLFLIGPKSAATIKIFNGFLFLVNGILVFFIALNLLERKKDCKLSLDVKNWLAAVTTILASLLIDNYLQYTLSDAYEIPTITVLLLLILTVITIQSPALSGALQAILYLCRPNMIVFAPFIWIYQISEEKTIRKRLRVTLFFAGAFILILTPFIIRNFILTGKLMFSYQQLFELYKNATASHHDLYNSFATAPSLFPITKKLLVNLGKKFLSEIVKPFEFAAKPEYLLTWIGIPIFIYRFKEDRKLLILILFALFTHIVFFSIYLQLERIYIPFFFLASIFGYLGSLEWTISRIQAFPKLLWLTNHSMLILSMVVLIITSFSVIHLIRPERDNRTRPPSSQAVAALAENNVKCVYSNDPYWIPWYADIVAIYSPTDQEDIFSKGPSECRYFIVDERKPYQTKFLSKYGTLIENGDNFSLYYLSE